jgi:hypothetical protein
VQAAFTNLGIYFDHKNVDDHFIDIQYKKLNQYYKNKKKSIDIINASRLYLLQKNKSEEDCSKYYFEIFKDKKK